MKQQIGDEHMSITDLKQRIQNGDSSIAQKILYFGASLEELHNTGPEKHKS
ncbi:hypothetical protein DPMN_152506 [Dreissena polymorpha]|uniref:Uncharacterized protein n=1 Tax=Dreissena polymorpha TaxID=45954 RepID=A0A9D4J7Z8_DREPO|nr:hypothetical protein DPMN_152506 [Dreissena polymorpha]